MIALAIGFAFDIYELLMLPLVIRCRALLELGGEEFRVGSANLPSWFSLLFYVPAVCGGIFGLIGGYLTDRLAAKSAYLEHLDLCFGVCSRVFNEPSDALVF